MEMIRSSLMVIRMVQSLI